MDPSVSRVADDDAADVLFVGDPHQRPGDIRALNADWLRTQILGKAEVLLQRALVLRRSVGPARRLDEYGEQLGMVAVRHPPAAPDQVLRLRLLVYAHHDALTGR